MKGKKVSKGKRGLLEEQQWVIQKIGERIKHLRIKKGYKSYELFAFENEIDRAQYGRFERGANMQIASLVKVLQALEISIEEFFSEGFGE